MLEEQRNPKTTYSPPPHRRRHQVNEGLSSKMLDIRTHDKIFRKYVPQEAEWLMRWGMQDPKTSNGNCHCVRALQKWEELKHKAQIKEKKRRQALRAKQERKQKQKLKQTHRG